MRTDVATYRLSLLRDAGPTSLGTRTVEVQRVAAGRRAGVADRRAPRRARWCRRATRSGSRARTWRRSGGSASIDRTQLGRVVLAATRSSARSRATRAAPRSRAPCCRARCHAGDDGADPRAAAPARRLSRARVAPAASTGARRARCRRRSSSSARSASHVGGATSTAGWCCCARARSRSGSGCRRTSGGWCAPSRRSAGAVGRARELSEAPPSGRSRAGPRSIRPRADVRRCIAATGAPVSCRPCQRPGRHSASWESGSRSGGSGGGGGAWFSAASGPGIATSISWSSGTGVVAFVEVKARRGDRFGGSGRSGQLAEAEGVRPFRPRLDRPAWPADGRLPLRRGRGARRGKSGASPPRRGRISAPPFGLISGPDLRILFGYRVARFSGTLMSAWPEESTTNERM